ncbi:MAG: hypothetical protein ACEY3D_08860 [Rickettsia sp.]|uniref:hypothetical protein n=1 Tax=Rickettsia sp. TaxID=789 RepID=UPI00397A9F3E
MLLRFLAHILILNLSCERSLLMITLILAMTCQKYFSSPQQTQSIIYHIHYCTVWK